MDAQRHGKRGGEEKETRRHGIVVALPCLARASPAPADGSLHLNINISRVSLPQRYFSRGEILL